MDNDAARVLHLLELSYSGDESNRKAASKELLALQNHEGYLLLTVNILQQENVADVLRQAAAISFKNVVKEKWVPKEEEPNVLSEKVRNEVKNHLVELMLSTPPVLQKQLQEAISIISESGDFPFQWESLLPHLVSKFTSGNFVLINGSLRTAEAILKRYRNQFKEENIIRELKYVLPIIQGPLLELAIHLTKHIASGEGDADSQVNAFRAILHVTNIFYSLNEVDLPEFFEEHAEEWMEVFLMFLSYKTNNERILEHPDDDDKPGLLTRVQASVCECVNLYIDKYDVEFKPYVGKFAEAMWELLMKTPNEVKYSLLAATAITFLTRVSEGIHHSLFNNEGIMKNVCEQIVIPNMILTEDDMENFEHYPVEYIRRDIEGSDTDTRRRSASMLVKGLRKNYEKEVTQILASYINGMLEQYNANPSDNWKQKDVCTFMVTALAVSSQSATKGALEVNALVPIMSFYESAILPDLQNCGNAHPVLLADALKFTTIFRHQLPAGAFSTLFELITKVLGSPCYVVNTYAAMTIERLLVMRNPDLSLKCGDSFKPFVPDMLKSLFTIINTKQKTGASGSLHNLTENEYVMKCILRIITSSGSDIVPFGPVCITELAKVLAEVAKGPQNPHFSHNLFESLGAVIKAMGKNDPSTIAPIESLLLPPFKQILAQDIVEFSSYVFQIMALLLELSVGTVPKAYTVIFPQLLVPALWARSGNIPALVRLLQAYIKKCQGSEEVLNYLEGVLGVFQKLISSKINDHEGFFLIESIVQHVPLAGFEKYMAKIWELIFTRLMNSKTNKFIRSFIIFISLFCAHHSPDYVAHTIDNVQGGLFGILLEQVWIPSVNTVSGRIERKICAVGMTKLLTESQSMQEKYSQYWTPFLAATMKVILAPKEEDKNNDEGEDEEANFTGFSTYFSRLAYGGRDDVDPFPEVEPKQFLAVQLHNLSKNFPGKFGEPLSQLDPQYQQALNQCFLEARIPEPYIL